MEVDEIQCKKFPRLNNIAKMGKTRNNTDDQNPDDGDNKRGTTTAVDLGSGIYNWPSSRIVRVSRATGGKDRHSKVLTSKGLRDRRVRLSVNTAIQFYDLQDRLGYDQPSKAVEWLLKAAATSIDDLPPINTLFPDTPKQLSYEKRSSTEHLRLDDTNNAGAAADPNFQIAQKSSACSSNSENSKGSGLSLSRCESRVKARERAKERVSEKEKEKENPISQATSFTELLNGGMSNNVNSTNSTTSPNGGTTNDYFQKSLAHWSSSPMDYFTNGLSQAIRPAQMYLAVNPPASSPLFSVTGEHHHHHELQHFPFVPDHLLASEANNNSSTNNNNGGSEYNLNFTISSGNNNSSGLAGYNGGTLQSNSSSSSPSLFPHLQRFPAIVDGTSSSFFIGTALPHVENQNHHQFLPGLDAQANNGRYSGHKGGKGRNKK